MGGAIDESNFLDLFRLEGEAERILQAKYGPKCFSLERGRGHNVAQFFPRYSLYFRPYALNIEHRVSAE